MSLCDRLADYFRSRPDQWIDARQLLPIAGFAAWRTRLSELRKPPYNLDIRNETRRVKKHDINCQPLICSCPVITESRYRLVTRKDVAA